MTLVSEAPAEGPTKIQNPLELPRTGRGGYTVLTWGCQMNEDDSAQMAAMLEGQGYLPAERIEDASVILLNTCSVRAKPERKVYSKLGELRELKALNPDLVIGVCGCMAQKEAPEIRRRAPYVDLVVGTGQIDRVPALVERVRQERDGDYRDGACPRAKTGTTRPCPCAWWECRAGRHPNLNRLSLSPTAATSSASSASSRSRAAKSAPGPAEDIVLEVERLASLGTKQVTLLGQTVNSYGKFLDDPCSFAELLARLTPLRASSAFATRRRTPKTSTRT